MCLISSNVFNKNKVNPLNIYLRLLKNLLDGNSRCRELCRREFTHRRQAEKVIETLT